MSQRPSFHHATLHAPVSFYLSQLAANSSFVNALVAALLEQHGEAVLTKLVFKGCNPVVRVLVEGAIDLGLQKSEERSHA